MTRLRHVGPPRGVRTRQSAFISLPKGGSRFVCVVPPPRALRLVHFHFLSPLDHHVPFEQHLPYGVDWHWARSAPTISAFPLAPSPVQWLPFQCRWDVQLEPVNREPERSRWHVRHEHGVLVGHGFSPERELDSVAKSLPVGLPDGVFPSIHAAECCV